MTGVCLLVGSCERRVTAGGVFHLFGQLVAGFDVVQARVVVLQALELVVGRFQRLVGHHQHVDALLEFDLGDLGALFVQQERGHFHRHLAVHGGGVVLHRLFLDDAQDLQRRDSVSRMWPEPPQRGQGMEEPSLRAGAGAGGSFPSGRTC
jgi:hypothetical protein